MAPKAGSSAQADAKPASSGVTQFKYVQRLDSADAIMAAVSSLSCDQPTAFQTSAWLAAIYRHLVPAVGVGPLGVTFTSDQAAHFVLPQFVLPMYVQRIGPTRIARFVDCGVSDYNAPLGHGGLEPKQLVSKLTAALKGVDVLVLERMVTDARNPLTQHPWATFSRLTTNVVSVPDGADALVRSRGKKFRKEVERCTRVLAGHGRWAFARAQTATEIETALATLERQQGERHADKGSQYALSAPEYAAFYRAILADPSGFTAIFTLSVNGHIIAVLLGLVHRTTFTLLRIANGGDAWKQVSPGRLIVVEAMRYYEDKGVTRFDMGMGDYAFKRGFGAHPAPLVDLVLPLTARGFPYAAAFHLKARLRQNQHLRAVVQRLRGNI